MNVVLEFVNTHDCESGSDELGDPEALQAWDDRTRSFDLYRQRLARSVAVCARDQGGAARSAAGNAGSAIGSEALAALDEAAKRARLVLRFGPPARLHADADGVEGAIGTLLAAVDDAQVSGDWERVKARSKASCRWVFYDRFRKRSGEWCAVAVCGNRVKAQEYRRRRKPATTRC